MDFTNDCKGAIVETAIACLLRHAGYPVAHAGIESLLPVLPLFGHGRYEALDLTPQLRLSPDLLILPHGAPGLQIEVKYRKYLDRGAVQKLLVKVGEQQACYPQTHTILVRSVSPRGSAARADDVVRVLPPKRLEILAAADLFYHGGPADALPEDSRMEPLWQALRPMTSTFDRLQGENREMLERLVPVFRSLAEL